MARPAGGTYHKRSTKAFSRPPVSPCTFCSLYFGDLKISQNHHSSESASAVPRDVADEGAGVEGDEREHDDADPDAGPEAEGEVLEPHALAEVEHDGLKHQDGPRRA